MEPFVFVAVVNSVFSILLGIPSNSVILYIYAKKKRRTASHFFIMGHAVVDLLICTIVLPVAVGQWLTLENFRSLFLCKTLNWVNQSAPLASLHVNTIVAFDRYFAVTRPHSRLVRGQKKSAAVVVCVILLAFLINVPQLIWRRIREVVYEGESPCYFVRDNVLQTIGIPLMVTSVYVVLIFTTIFLYAQVYRKVKRLRKNRIENLHLPSNIHTLQASLSTAASSGPGSASPIPPRAIRWGPLNNDHTDSHEKAIVGPKTLVNTSIIRHSGNPKDVTTSQTISVQGPEQTLTNATFRMLFIVTVIFIFTWTLQLPLRMIPKTILSNVRANQPGLYALYIFLVNLFTLNSSTNAVVYSFVNPDFRRQVLSLRNQLLELVNRRRDEGQILSVTT